MDDEYMEARPGDMEAYRRLDAYADARLAPDPAAMRRIRAHVMAAAVAFAEERRGTVSAAVIPLRRAAQLTERRRHARVAGSLLAAALTLGLAAGSVAAAQPGGPLYGARLMVETVMLPASGNARAEAQVDRLDERVAEIGAAVAAGDSSAAAAALDAYSAILAELDAQATADPSIADDVRDDVARHLAILEALAGRVPAQAREALEHALDRSDNALDHLGGAGAGQPSAPGAPGNPGGGNPGAGNPDRTPGGSKPDRTPPAAQPTPKPVRTPPTVQPTPKPPKTPPAVQPTPKPPKTPPAVQPTPKPPKTPPAAKPSSPRRTP